MVGETNKIRRGENFCKIGDTGDTIQGEDSARQCFVVRTLISMNFLKNS